jgi:predicted glycogen debranching enzyme
VNSPPSALVRRIDVSAAALDRLPALLDRQWLVSNGLGGFASGTIAGAVTWRYHGLLVAALPAPFGRTVMLNHLAETLRFPGGRRVQFGGIELAGGALANYLREFRLEDHLPVWRYEIDGVVIEKRVVMPALQNTVHVTYTLLSAQTGCRLELRPAVHFRPFEASVGTRLDAQGYEMRVRGRRFEIGSRAAGATLRLMLTPAADVQFAHDGGTLRTIEYARDAERGYEAKGELWSPGRFAVALQHQAPATLVASTEEWHVIEAMTPETALATERQRRARLLRLAHPAVRSGVAAELVLAADQFVIVPSGRVADAARARAAGDELRSVIAGYHWFTDWGRDTMISLEGLTLVTGRHHEAGWILRTFAHYVRDGLIPNLFPEGQNEGLYHTADATLWFFHAVHRYVTVTGDREALRALLPTLRAIISAHLHGTRFGIGVDRADGLLRQGAPGYQLTWMDAKVGDWVVTPRAGKAVEINALWYNALRLLEGWSREQGDGAMAAECARWAELARQSFNARFWNEAAGCLFDVVDGGPAPDAAIRPNQLLAVSLPHAVLARERWEAVVATARRELLTPFGLRSLARSHPDYKANYQGDLRARDAAYHQGTVWTWLIGPFIDAWLKVHPHDRATARGFLDAFPAHLSEACVGSINEIFDAEPPFAPRGCIAQAWSVAEVLRCYALTAPDVVPEP